MNHISTMYDSTPELDRSPSLSSNSSGTSSSVSSLPPITPALHQLSSFPSSSYPHSPNSSLLDHHSSKVRPAKIDTGAGAKTGPWSAGHRTGAGSSSFGDAKRMWSGLERNDSVGGGGGVGLGLGRSPSPVKEGSEQSTPRSVKRATWGYGQGSGNNSAGTSPSPTKTNGTTPLEGSPRTTSSSPTRKPLPSIPFPPSSPTRSSTNSPTTSTSARQLSSSIFSSRAATNVPIDQQPRSTSPVHRSRFDSFTPSTSTTSLGGGLGRQGTHRRANTLPHNTLLNSIGLPLPPDDLAGGAEVAGLPGRARLSRPADVASPFAPSAVFSSSHGLSREAAGGGGGGSSSLGGKKSSGLPSQTVKAIDVQREKLAAYEYLCHIRETQQWLESSITSRPASAGPLYDPETATISFDQSLKDGYALAHLARSLGSEKCQGGIYNDPVRHFRHTENINIFFQFISEVGLPDLFRFETVDLYDGKNLHKVIFCLHALSLLLYRRGMTGRMEDLNGKVEFSDAELNATDASLNGVRMPNFKGISKALDRHEPSIIEEVVETEEERQVRLAEPLLATFGARARGALARRRYATLLRAHQRQLRVEAEERARLAHEADLERQRLAREAELERQRLELERQRLAAEEEEREYERQVAQAAAMLAGFQAISRGALVRRRFYAAIDRLQEGDSAVVGLQACIRGALVRREMKRVRGKLSEVGKERGIVGLQSLMRGVLARRRLLGEIRKMRGEEDVMVGVQAQVRGLLARRAFQARASNLRRVEVVRSVGGFQSAVRAALVKRRVVEQRRELGFVEPDVVGIQAAVRGYLARRRFVEWREALYDGLDDGRIERLQAVWRGELARRKYWSMRNELARNGERIGRLQAAIRARRLGGEYRQLRMGTNVPVGTIKNFVRLLDDSEWDYQGEIMVEALRKELIGRIRETQVLEDEVKSMDTKIALLVKNKITHEVVRARGGTTIIGGGGGLAPSRRHSLLLAANDPFAIAAAGETALDRSTQRKLELYQQMFWHLQIQPAYFARLFANTARIGLSDKVQKQVETTTNVVFGYAQAQREEFLLLKLLQRSIQEELVHLPNVASFVRGNFIFIRLLMQYGRGVSQRQVLGDMLGPQVQAIMARSGLDLGTDPILIYRQTIQAEETRTGVATSRPVDVDYPQAVSDPETNAIFVNHLIALRRATAAFLSAMYASTRNMPFGVRYVAREVFRSLRDKFPNEPEHDVLRVAGHVVYYRFIQPAIVAPETFGIIEGVVPPVQRQNLAEVCKMLNQISVGRLFGPDQQYLTAMNGFIAESVTQFSKWIYDVIHVEDAEDHFRTDEFLDATASRRPVIYISPNDIYSTHSIIADHVDVIAPDPDDPLRAIVVELGGAPSSSTPELSHARAEEIALPLITRIRAEEDPDASNKALFNQAKRRVLAILKVHHGADLEAVLARVVTDEDEETWDRIMWEEQEEERRTARRPRPAVGGLVTDDLRQMSFQELKMAALQDIVKLRQTGKISKADKYQALLNAIAHDIRSKHHRRVQRQNELATIQATLTSLRDKKSYLSDQIKSYHTYIDQSMASIQKKSKKSFVFPWSMQASHQRALEKAGKRYQFGSYKYTAQNLYDRGILLSIDQYSPKQFDKISLTISSDSVGVFEITAKFMGATVTTVELSLEELLEMQFQGKRTVSIGGIAKANLNLLVNLVNAKFFA